MNNILIDSRVDRECGFTLLLLILYLKLSYIRRLMILYLECQLYIIITGVISLLESSTRLENNII